MNEIVQHIPMFAWHPEDEPNRANFDSISDLLEVPFVNAFVKEKEFYRLSVSGNKLIAEQRGGRSWWVIGFLREPIYGLPEWDHGIYEVVDQEGNIIEVPGRDVSYICGDDISLKDGRILKRLAGVA